MLMGTGGTLHIIACNAEPLLDSAKGHAPGWFHSITHECPNKTVLWHMFRLMGALPVACACIFRHQPSRPISSQDFDMEQRSGTATLLDIAFAR